MSLLVSVKVATNGHFHFRRYYSKAKGRSANKVKYVFRGILEVLYIVQVHISWKCVHLFH